MGSTKLTALAENTGKVWGNMTHGMAHGIDMALIGNVRGVLDSVGTKLNTQLHTEGMPKKAIYESQDMVLRSSKGGKDLPMGVSVRASWLMK